VVQGPGRARRRLRTTRPTVTASKPSSFCAKRLIIKPQPSGTICFIY
jgi:hypothetical protein